MRRASCAGPHELRRFRVGAVPSTTAEAPAPASMSTAGGAVTARGSVSAGAAAPRSGSAATSAARWRMGSRKEVINSAEGGAAPVGSGPVSSSSGVSPGGWAVHPTGEGTMPVRGDAGAARGDVKGRGGVVCCHCWCAVRGLGGCVPPPICASSGPRGGGVPFAERRGDVGVRARGAALSLPPAFGDYM